MDVRGASELATALTPPILMLFTAAVISVATRPMALSRSLFVAVFDKAWALLRIPVSAFCILDSSLVVLSASASVLLVAVLNKSFAVAVASLAEAKELLSSTIM